MKKSTIWLLIVVMALTFGTLLYFQLTYLERIAGMRNEQFTESVMRSLYSTSGFLERQETLRFLEEDISEMEAALYDNSELTTELPPHPVISDDGKVQFPSPTQTIGNRYQTIHDMLRGRYLYQRGLLNEVILTILSEGGMRPVTERADSAMLRSFLETELSNNGLNVPFEYAVANSSGQILYQSANYGEPSPKEIYSQVLFPNSANRYQLNVVFPTKDDYIYSSLRFIVPSLALTLILLVVFVYTILTVFKQKKLSEMKTDFINNMTHELKTPISSISLAAQMLDDDSMTKSPSTLHHISRIIIDESKRLRFQVDKVLQMSVFDKDSSSALIFREVDANKVIANVVNTFKITVEKYGGELSCSLDAKDANVYVDEMQFTNVIFNLCDNAVKYKRDDVPPRIDISTSNVGKWLEIRIKDNGIGIKKDDLKRIFDKFYRVPTGNRHDVKGFGLGLPYVKRIVTLFDGNINVSSEPDVGTVFTIRIPLLNASNKK